jgi:hypothetical protein
MFDSGYMFDGEFIIDCIYDSISWILLKFTDDDDYINLLKFYKAYPTDEKVFEAISDRLTKLKYLRIEKLNVKVI